MDGIAELFVSSFAEKELKEISRQIPEGLKESFIYFNNTTYDAGYSNAYTLKSLMNK